MSLTSVSEIRLPSPLVALQIRVAPVRPRLVIVDHDGFEIGGSEQCDLCLPRCGIPKLHSILHVQGGAVWIEAAHEDAVISIDGEDFRRRALRDGDEISFGETTLTVHIGVPSVEAARPIPQPHTNLEDRLSLLTAEELCDLIELEESQTQEYDRRRRMGLKALLSAIHDAAEIEGEQLQRATVPQAGSPSDDRFDELVAQIRGLSDTLEERTRELAAQETLLLESSSQLTEAQRRVNRQLEQLIERITPDESAPDELRVSA